MDPKTKKVLLVIIIIYVLIRAFFALYEIDHRPAYVCPQYTFDVHVTSIGCDGSDCDNLNGRRIAL